MKQLLTCLLCLSFFAGAHAQIDVEKAGSTIKGLLKKKPKPQTTPAAGNTQQPANDQNNTTDNSNTAAPTTEPPSTKAYANYDFVPGDTVLFEDDFTGDQDGEFPSHWDLMNGQAVLNNLGGVEAFYFTDGNYAKAFPRMKKKNYLTDPFTVEFDYYQTAGSYSPVLFLNYTPAGGGDVVEGNLTFDKQGGVSTGYFPNDMQGSYPGEKGDAFFNKWHHAAMIYKSGQIKCYVDQYRVMIIPNTGIVPLELGFGGIGGQSDPIIIKDVRVAAGGKMNMIGKKFTEAKIVTHGITFDVDKSTIKPESMGTLNMVAGVLKANPDIKFEIDGHTDNTGTAAHNITLSQQRADAVKMQLVSMGIDAARLTTKGFGDTKPINSNDTPEGKANNRRVEFVKM